VILSVLPSWSAKSGNCGVHQLTELRVVFPQFTVVGL
jgi:hypothetical protein